MKFDTGAKPVTWNPVRQVYEPAFHQQSIPITGTYLLTTGGINYYGSFGYTITTRGGDYPFEYRLISTVGYPNSVSLSAWGGDRYVTSDGPIVDFVADNGYHLKISPHEGDWGVWAQDAIAVVPEPSEYATGVSILLLGFAAWRSRSVLVMKLKFNITLA